MKTVSGSLTAHLQLEVTTVAVIWKVERIDGIVMAFTDHDEDVIYEGLTYKASSGFLRSAISNSATLSSDELEVQGFVDDESITARDLRIGKFDYATITIRLINYEDLTMGHVDLRHGRFGEVIQTASGKFTIELRGLVAQLGQQIGEVYSPDCRVDLFSAKCGLKAIPDQRVAASRYEAGTRVLVRDDVSDQSYQLPLVNPGFRSISYADMETWLLEDCLAGDITALSKRGVTTQQWVTRVSQTVDVAAIRTVGLADTTATVTVKRSSNSSFQMSRLTLTALDASDVVLELFALDYTLIPTNVTAVTLTTGFLPTGTTQVRFEVQTRKLNTPTYPASEPFTAAQQSYFTDFDVRLLGSAFDSGNIVADVNFTTGATTTATLSGWTGSITGTYTALTQIYGFFGRDGGAFLRDNSSNTSAVQLNSTSISLTGGPVTSSDIDTGNYVIDLAWWQANIDIDGAADAVLVFSGPGITTVAGTLVLKEINPSHEWQQRRKTIAVPVGARTVVVRTALGHSRNNFSGYSMATVTDFTVQLRNKDTVTYDFSVYGGVEYEALTTGITANAVATSWSRTLGAVVTDGTVSWSVVAPNWSNLAQITQVTSRGKFKFAAVNRPDGWFRWGLIKFLSGDNEGYSVECVKWNNTTKEMELALPLPFLPAIGDQVWLQVGCDKSMTVCAAKFANGINFRGEPNIPGTDTMFRIGSPIAGSR